MSIQASTEVFILLTRLNRSYEILMMDPTKSITLPDGGYLRVRELFRQAFAELGLNLDQPENVKAMLARQKFQTSKEELGRDQGVLAVLGEDLATLMLNESDRIALEYIKNDYTSGKPDKGVDQTLADMLAIGLCDEEQGEKAWVRLQRRIWKGYLRLATHRKSSFPADWKAYVNGVFVGLEEPSNTLASCPAGGAVEMWNFLVAELLKRNHDSR